MKGGGFYDRYSGLQGAAAAAAWPVFERALEDLPPAPGGAFGLLDLGSSTGHNALGHLARVAETLRRRFPAAPIRATFSDLPTNDWNAFLAELDDAAHHGHGSLVDTRAAGIFPDIAVGSMYEGAILPRGAVQVASCLVAIHWLSSVPAASLGRAIDPLDSAAPREARDAWAEQSRIDLQNFLVARSEELSPGGVALILAPARAMRDHFVSLFHQALVRAEEGGVTPPRLLDTFAYPLRVRALDEFREGVDADELPFRLLAAEEISFELPVAGQLARRDLEGAIEHRAGELRAVSEGLLNAALARCEVARPRPVVDAIFDEVRVLAREEFAQPLAPCAALAITLERTGN